MKLSFLFAAAALVILASGRVAQQQKDGVPKKEATPVPAAAPLAMTKVKVDLMLPVVGLTADNATKIKTALEAMKADLYRCAECKADFAKAGDCPKCKKPLTMSKETVLGMVTTDVTKGQITLQSKEGMALRLSALEHTLQAARPAGVRAVRVSRSGLVSRGWWRPWS